MILLTGASGFIGSQIVQKFPNIVPLRIKLQETATYTHLIQSLPSDTPMTLIHCASSLTVRGNSPEQTSMDYFSEGFNFFMQLAAHFKKLHIIYPSSGGALYKYSNNTPFMESDELSGRNLYTQSKICHESFLYYLQKNQPSVNVSILRISNPYGSPVSTNRKQGIIGVALKCLREDTPLNVFSKMDTVRDYVHFDDLIAIINLIIHDTKSRSKFEVFNIGSGQGHSIGKLIQSIEDVFEKKIKVMLSENQTSIDESPWCILNIDKVKIKYNWSPKIELLTGLQLMKDQMESIK